MRRVRNLRTSQLGPGQLVVSPNSLMFEKEIVEKGCIR